MAQLWSFIYEVLPNYKIKNNIIIYKLFLLENKDNTSLISPNDNHWAFYISSSYSPSPNKSKLFISILSLFYFFTG